MEQEHQRIATNIYRRKKSFRVIVYNGRKNGRHSYLYHGLKSQTDADAITEGNIFLAQLRANRAAMKAAANEVCFTS